MPVDAAGRCRDVDHPVDCLPGRSRAGETRRGLRKRHPFPPLSAKPLSYY